MQRSILFLFAILILSTSTLNADIGPGPSPRNPKYDLPPEAVPIDESTNPTFTDSVNVSAEPSAATDTSIPAKSDSPVLADVPPVPVLTSPTTMVIAGVAATAGVVLLGLWISKKGRSGNSQDQ